MGIRVKKVLGYGLTDLKGIEDSRLREGFDPYDDLPPASEFVKFCNEQMAFMYDKECRLEGRGIMNWTAAHFSDERGAGNNRDHCGRIVFEDEGGMDDVLVLVPYGMPDWHRYDDIMDYIEELYIKDDGPQPWVYTLPAGIYPYSARWMDSRTGRDVQHVTCILDVLKSLNDKPDDMPLSEHWELAYASEPDLPNSWNVFKNLGEIRRHLAPKIPWDITAMCRFLKLFKHDTTILQLRPMMYCYWS